METYDIHNQPKTDDKPKGYVSKLLDTVSISRAEYELLLRDKTELDLVLATRLHSNDYSFSASALLDTILKHRGMLA